MRKLILAATLAAITAAPAISHAATRCERQQQNNQAAGTVVGAGVGALLGNAVAGRGNRTAGTVIGGIGGAVVGNQLAKPGQPCPDGYYAYDDAAPPPPAPTPAYAPAPAYGPAPYAGGYDRERFWAGAPERLDDRIAFLEDRVRRGRDDGSLTRGEAARVMDRISDVRRQEYQLTRRDGGRLNRADRDYLRSQLEDVSQQIRWARANDNRDYGRPSYRND